MLKQYNSIKEKHPTELLLFRLGDFFELFGEDAKEAARILNIVLTARQKGTPNEMPMCGIPHHALNNYLPKLLKAGKRVAICDQVSDPSLPGIVKREVIRVITPGTTIDDNTLNNKDNNYIISLHWQKDLWGVAIADLTTGQFQCFETKDFNLIKNEIFRLNASEFIVNSNLTQNTQYNKFLESLNNVNIFDLAVYDKPENILLNHFNVKNLSSFGISNQSQTITSSASLLKYLKETQKTELNHITKIEQYRFVDFMILDEATIRNLELFNIASTGDYQGSLLSVIDKTITNMGGRLLRRWLLMPLLQVQLIKERLEAVGEIKENHVLIKKLVEQLKQMSDLERLLGKIGCARVNARELVALKASLQLLPEIKALLKDVNSAKLKNYQAEVSDHQELVELLDTVFVEEPPVTIMEGGIIKDGYHDKLDELRAISKGGKDWLAKFQAEEIEKTKISSLKVKYNKVFGYYIEISRANLDQVPENYTRKQTLVNAERFITPELKEYEEKILTAEEQINNIEYQIFAETVEKIMKYFPEVQQSAQKVTELDVLLSFALLANENNYCCPEVSDSGEIVIKDGRHPVIEKFQSDRYVPNDLEMDHKENEFILLTGPNMSGKSSYLRQVALICLMAQIGCFVPANHAKVGVIDRIFTRVGASDNLAQGVSTFMVEMQEAANILNNSTERSLIILDELGRGTSTYDGVSIAWAIIEFLHDQIKAKTLFATHYHELTQVTDKMVRANNYCVAVSEESGKVIFLHKIIKGASSRSYGIEVAKLAGLPKEIIKRADVILAGLESKTDLKVDKSQQSSLQLGFSKEGEKLTKALAKVEPDQMTPIEALQKINELKELLED